MIRIEKVSKVEVAAIDNKFKELMIKDKRKTCKSHGFTVRRKGSDLLVTGNDYRYNKPGEMINVLKSLGFKYSMDRNMYYWSAE